MQGFFVATPYRVKIVAAADMAESLHTVGAGIFLLSCGYFYSCWTAQFSDWMDVEWDLLGFDGF